MNALLQDIRYGLRMMFKRLGVTVLVIVTLALGIGVNSSMFNLVNATILKPLPVDRPDDLTVLYSTKRNTEGYNTISYPDYVDLRDRNNVFTDLIAYSVLPLNMSEGGRGERVWCEIVTGNYFSMLGVEPLLGRSILTEDDKVPDGHPVTVLSYSFWMKRFAGDPQIIGKTISLNGHSFNVIGVAPKDFRGIYYVGFSPALWLPMMMQQKAAPGSNSNSLAARDNRWLNVMGRLKPGISVGQAEAALQINAQQLEQTYPQTNKDRGITLFREIDARPEPEMAGTISLAAMIFLVLVGLVLLLACANVTNLLLAQASARRREIALRLALGSSRTRLIRQLLTESVLISLISGFVSLALVLAAGKGLNSIIPQTDIPFELDLALDYNVVIYTFVVSVLAGILFGLLPALRLRKTELVTTLKEEGGRGSGGKHLSRLHGLLVTAQITVSMVLLIMAGLFVRSMQSAKDINPGFDTKNALIISLDLGLQGYDEQRGRSFYRNLIDRIKVLPNVSSITTASPIPLDFISNSEDVFIIGRNDDLNNSPISILRSIVGPDYFRNMGTAIVSGRDFSESEDGTQMPKSVIINETMAKRYWPGQSVIGKQLRIGSGEDRIHQIVGIAKDGKYRTLGENPQPYFYLPFSQNYPKEYSTLVVRSTGSPNILASTIRQQVQALDPKLPVFDIKTMDDHMGRSLLSARVSAIFTAIFGTLALMLALIGLYGIIWYSVVMRTREIGIRMALGAEQGTILRLVLVKGLGMTLIGIIMGLITTFAVTRVISNMLYGINAIDIITFSAVVLLFAFCAILACYFPARRATNINPIITLRNE